MSLAVPAPNRRARLLAVSVLALLVLLPAAVSEAGTLTVVPSPPAGGHITASPGTINCPTDCTHTYFVTEGNTLDVTLTVTTNPGFQNISGCNPTCVVGVTSENSSVTISFRETVAPSVTATPQLASGSRAFQGMKLRANASDASGIARVEYLVNGNAAGQSTVGATNFEVPLDASGFTHGQSLSIVAKAVDGAGNIANSTAVAATVDKRADATFVDPSPPDGALTGAATVSYAFTKAGDVTGAVCLLDGVPVETPCTSPFDVSPQADGQHTVAVRATDDVGNTTEWTRALRIDRTAPVIAFGDLTAPLPARPQTTVAFTITDDGEVTTSCKLDAGEPGPCTSNSQHTMTGLSDGQHTLAVTATDSLGNTETDLAVFTVDATAPALALTDGPAEGAHVAAKGVAFKFTADAGATVECSLDSDSAFGPCSGGAGEDRRDGLGEGEHTFRVRATDALGNAATVARAFVVDTVAPVLRITGGPAQGSTFRDRVADFSFEAEAGAAVVCRLDGGAFRACSAPASDRVAGLADGSHTFAVRATDRAGNATTVERTFKVVPSNEVRGALKQSWKRAKGLTQVRILSLARLSPNAKITLSCKGRGCPKTKVFKPRKTTVNLAPALRGRKLRPGAVITIRIEAPGFLGRTTRLTIRRGRDPKSVTTADKAPA